MYPSEVKVAVSLAIASNLRKKEDLQIGAEIENIVYDKHFRRLSANPEDDFSTSDLRNFLDLQNSSKGINPSLTIEPGGQIECASRPYTQLKELDRELRIYTRNLLIAAKEENLILSDLALEPVLPAEKIIIIDQNKYKLMHRRFSETGTLGHEMMLNSASIQINLDYTSLIEAGQMAFVADCLHPVTALMFANTPFFRGQPSGVRNMREIIWRNTDPIRSNCLIDHGIIEIETLVDDYSDYVLKTPGIFTFEKDGSVRAYNGILGDWLTSLHTTGDLNRTNVMIALHQIFTQVRFKHVLEIRGPDRLPFGYELAPIAFFQGLFRSPSVFAKTLSICQEWPVSERHKLNAISSTLDFNQTVLGGITLNKLCEQFLSLAIDGLSEFEDVSFLQPFAQEFLEKGPFSIALQELFHESGKSVEKFLRDRWESQKEVLVDYTKI